MSVQRRDQSLVLGGTPVSSEERVVEVGGWSEVWAEAETGTGRKMTKGEFALYHTA